MPPVVDHVTLLNAFDDVIHFACLWLGVALAVIIMLRWFPRQLHPPVRAWWRFGTLFIGTLLAWLTIFYLLPTAAYGRLTSPGLVESFIQAAKDIAMVTGSLLLIFIVFQAGRVRASR